MVVHTSSPSATHLKLELYVAFKELVLGAPA